MSLRAVPASVAIIAAVALLLPASTLHAQSPKTPSSAAPPPVPDSSSENAPDGSVLPIPPVPPRIVEGAEYDHCLDMLDSDPSGADALAATMAANGGGDAAEHCHALAQVALGNTDDGAMLLDKLATTSTAPSSFRAVVFGQADQAWTMAGRPDMAFASATNAIKLSPDDPDLLIGHAIAALALQRYNDAAADLTHALDLDPKRADALVLRATAWRNLQKLAQAKADIDSAFALDPDDPDALLERGIIRQRQGDLAGARKDWEQASELAPDTSTGDLAQQNLALLAAGPRQ
jgi:tetratricopeptide (TPR) repeat protein